MPGKKRTKFAPRAFIGVTDIFGFNHVLDAVEIILLKESPPTGDHEEAIALKLELAAFTEIRLRGALGVMVPNSIPELIHLIKGAYAGGNVK